MNTRGRRVTVTPPPGVGTYVKGGITYVSHKDAWRLLTPILEQDRGLLSRLAED